MFRKFTIALAFLALTGLMFAGCSNKKLVEQKDAQISALQDELGQLEGSSPTRRPEPQNSSPTWTMPCPTFGPRSRCGCGRRKV